MTSPEDFKAVGDGKTNDSAAFVRMLASTATVFEMTLGKNYLIDPNVLDLTPGYVLRGLNSGGYSTVDTDDNAAVSKITIAAVKSFDPTTDPNWNTDHPAYWGIKSGTKGRVEHVQVVAQNLAQIPTYLANYPGAGNKTGVGSVKPTGAATAGILAANSEQLDSVTAKGFKVGISTGKVAWLTRCFATQNDYGYWLRGSDGWLRDCVAMFNFSAGAQGVGNYWQFHGGRYEWNARYGIVTSAENTTEGATFDRNGWAGLYLAAGRWGQVVSGNTFTRNGVGGNGTTGRWNWSTPKNASYVETPAGESCHIKIDSQRGVAIDGNRFRAGGDDAKTGVVGPVYILSSAAKDKATGARLELGANAGMRGDSALGYSPSGAGYKGVIGAVAGGSDLTMAKAINDQVGALT